MTTGRTKRRARAAVGAVLAVGVGAGCGSPDATNDEPAPTSAEPARPPAMEPLSPPEAPEPETVARVEELTRWLGGCAVSPGDAVRSKLYSWTTTEQVDALIDGRRLLSRERHTNGALSGFDRRIAEDDHALSRHLRAPGRRARRFAWSNPWAARMGWEHGAYGEELLEITMREDAWYAVYEPDAGEPWRVLDEHGEEVPTARALRHASRIGAVLHVGRGPDPEGRERIYREVVIVNERQVERWSVGAESIELRLSRDAERLRALAAHWRTSPTEVPPTVEALTDWLANGWTSDEGEDPVVDAYRDCLAIGSTAYRPDPDAIVSIADALDATPRRDPVSRRPRPRPPVVRRRPPLRPTPTWVT